MIYILSAIFLWSSMGIVVRLSGVPVHLLMFSSSLFSACMVGCLFFKREYRRKFPDVKSIACFAGIVPINLLNTFSYFYAYRNTTIANSVLTHYIAPILVAFLAPVFLKEQLTGRILAAVGIAAAGLWILLDVSPAQFWSSMLAGERNTAGIISGLLSGVAYAMVLIALRVFSQNLHPLVMTFFQSLITAMILLPFIGTPEDLQSLLWASAVMGFLHYSVAPILYFKGLQSVTANRAAILGNLEPVCAILLGIVFLGEALSYLSLIGGTLILFSGYITVKDSKMAS